MSNQNSTVNGRAVARVGAGTFQGVVVNTPAPYGRHSIHDCADPGQAEIWNCIWPINLASPDGKTVKNGIVVHTVEPGGNFTVTHSS